MYQKMFKHVTSTIVKKKLLNIVFKIFWIWILNKIQILIDENTK